jgi:hypothetical protein
VKTKHFSINFQEQRDVQSYTNYRGIKLISHTIKLCEKIIEHRLKGVPTSPKINLILYLCRRFFFDNATYGEMQKAKKKDMYMIFIDLKNVYDKVTRNVI